MSVDAIAWARHQRARDHIAKHVLLTLATMADWQRCEVYYSQGDQAEQCQLSDRRIRSAWADLYEDGLITVVRRIRANGAKALPVILLNCPWAPHVKGKPVVLDYQGRFLFPEDPDAVHAAGVSWISATEPGRVHPKHSEDCTVDGVTYASPAARQGGGEQCSGGEGNSVPVGGEQCSGAGGEQCSGLTPCTDSGNINQGPPAGADGDGDEPPREENGANAPSQDEDEQWHVQARDLLQRARAEHAPGLKAHPSYLEAVAAQLAAGYDPDVVLKALTDGIESYTKPAAGVAANVADLGSLLAEIEAHSGAQSWESAAPEWCGECQADEFRFTVDDDSRMARCTRCNPAALRDASN